MTGTYVDKNYVYAVARVRGIESQLLTNQTFSELMGASDATNIQRILKEKGWGKDTDKGVESMLKSEREKLWEFIDEIVPDNSVFDVFKLTDDYHNLKAAIKESTMEYAYEGIYMQEGVTDYRLIRDCIKNKTYDDLPAHLCEVAKEAHELFLTTGDGQLCDIIVDRKSLEDLAAAGKKHSIMFLRTYAELSVASSNIKVAIRSSLTGKDREFMEKAISECDSLDKITLINAAMSGVDSICSYLQSTDYREAVDEIKVSLTSFERWCDNLLINDMKSQLVECFGLGPIAAYILARENEIKNVRIIYTARLNGFSDEIIKERVREAYV